MGHLTETSIEDGVARLRLVRPEKRNAISGAMAAEIHEAMAAFDHDDSVLAIVVEGSGGAFSAGADMTESLAAYEAGDRRFNPSAAAAARVGSSPKPTIAMIEGPAYGAGALLACACDIRVLAEGARFRFPGAEYGLVVGAAGLTRLAGNALAKELILTSRVVEAEEALRIGLANRVVPAADLERETLELARQIAQNSPLAAQWSKRVIDAPPGEAEALEVRADLLLRGGPDHRERFAKATERITGRGAS
jgi:enoyl-CoA hydratase/carnithine racemase